MLLSVSHSKKFLRKFLLIFWWNRIITVPKIKHHTFCSALEHGLKFRNMWIMYDFIMFFVMFHYSFLIFAMNKPNVSFIIKLIKSLVFLSYIFPLVITSITKYIYIQYGDIFNKLVHIFLNKFKECWSIEANCFL